jgi:hypothetical protein
LGLVLYVTVREKGNAREGIDVVSEVNEKEKTGNETDAKP